MKKREACQLKLSTEGLHAFESNVFAGAIYQGVSVGASRWGRGATSE